MNKTLLKIAILLFPLVILSLTLMLSFMIQSYVVREMTMDEDGGMISVPYWMGFTIPFLSFITVPLSTLYSIKLWIKYIHHEN